MKVNEAPEKIYITPHFKRRWFTKEIDDVSVEYTCTDAFIEKACEYWYQYNRNIVKNHGAKAVLGCNEFTVNVEDFKNYMKGE